MDLLRCSNKYGDKIVRWTLAKAIVNKRKRNRIESTSQLAEIIGAASGKSPSTLSRIFQAVRIEVNEELDSLAKGWMPLSI